MKGVGGKERRNAGKSEEGKGQRGGGPDFGGEGRERYGTRDEKGRDEVEGEGSHRDYDQKTFDFK